MLVDAGVVHAVTDTLTAIDVDADTIQRIIGILETYADDVNDGRPDTLATASLGGSDQGAQLGYHTGLAHQKVVEAMLDMVAGLKGYTANLQQYHKELLDSDDASGYAGTTIGGKVDGVSPVTVPSLADSTACTSAPTVHTNNACTLPTGGN